jgi:predicted dienelactone hydrolase
VNTQRGLVLLSLGVGLVVLASACGRSASETTSSNVTTATSPAALIPATSAIQPATEINVYEKATLTPIPVTPAAVPFPLSLAGPYFPGRHEYILQKGEALGGGTLPITIWYPAEKPADFKGTLAKDAPPDQGGAPYPLLLTSTVVGELFGSHLASYGFIVAGVDNQGPQEQFGTYLIDYPKEILFMLDQLASSPPTELADMIDVDHSGAFGYSFSGLNTLFLGGARVDPEFYRSYCAQGPVRGSSPTQNIMNEDLYNYFCAMASSWDEFSENAGAQLTTSNDGLWQPLSDERIRAVMPMAPDGPGLLSERGLAFISLPTLMICGTNDSKDTDYQKACVYTFENLGSQDKSLISFVDQAHLMVFDDEPQTRMKHFMTAFFGYHLQGKKEYQEYYSADFVKQFDDLVFGVYEKP